MLGPKFCRVGWKTNLLFKMLANYKKAHAVTKIISLTIWDVIERWNNNASSKSMDLKTLF